MKIEQQITNPERFMSILRIAIGDLETELRSMDMAELQGFTSLESSKAPIRQTIKEYESIIDSIKQSL